MWLLRSLVVYHPVMDRVKKTMDMVDAGISTMRVSFRHCQIWKVATLHPETTDRKKTSADKRSMKKTHSIQWDWYIFTYIYICHENPTIHVGESTTVPLFYGKSPVARCQCFFAVPRIGFEDSAVPAQSNDLWMNASLLASRFKDENGTTWGLMVSPCKMVVGRRSVGRRSFPIAKGTFQGRTVKLWGGNWTVGKSVSAK